MRCEMYDKDQSFHLLSQTSHHTSVSYLLILTFGFGLNMTFRSGTI